MCLLLLCLFLAVSLSLNVRESVGEWSRTVGQPFHPATKQTIRIAMRQRNLEILESTLWAISDPLSSSYGQYLNHEQIASLIAPPRESIEVVMHWLQQHGADNIAINRHRDMIEATLPVHQLERMFDTKFSVYTHSTGKKILRSQYEVSIPTKLQEFVDLIHGINDFPPVMRNKSLAMEKIKIREMLKDAQEPYQPLFVGVGSRGAADRITLRWIPIGADGKPVTDPNYSAGISWSYKYLDKEEGGMSSVDNNNCKKQSGEDYLLCSYTIVDDALTYQFLEEITLTVYKDGEAHSSVYPFPVVATPPIIPQKLWDFYGVPRNPTVNDASFAQCVVEFEQQYYSPSDLALFFQEMALPTNATVVEVGPNNATDPGGEANLDIQWMMAMAPGIPTWFWSIKATSSEEIDDILQWSYAIGNTTNPPIVNSISYGMTAKNVDKYLGNGYLARSDVEFMKLATMGITIIIADGDNGAGDLGDPPMLADSCETKLNPDWPSQSPYITSVGSTYITPLAEPICYKSPSEGGVDCSKFMPEGEVAVSLDNGIFWSTGGGFADYPARPPYQNQHISAYLNNTNNLPPSSFFNAAGRGYPDVSAVGHNLLTVIAGENIPVDGTSASAPIFGGLISLLTDIRLKAGKPALGFLNPLLYQISRDFPDAFYDVVVGENKCSVFNNAGPSCCPYGYRADVGWDAVTGLGTPNFQVLSKAVLQYPKK